MFKKENVTNQITVFKRVIENATGTFLLDTKDLVGKEVKQGLPIFIDEVKRTAVPCIDTPEKANAVGYNYLGTIEKDLQYSIAATLRATIIEPNCEYKYSDEAKKNLPNILFSQSM